MSGLVYTRYELLRAFRNRRFFFFSLAFPLILYFIFAAPNRNVTNFDGSGISLPLYYMVGLASFGTMVAMISSGARIAAERQIGWTRQLRITPLSTRAYFRAKLLTGYLMSCLTIGLLYIAGASQGVSLSAHSWLEMTGLILIALLPFAALGVMLGHLLNVDSIGPVTGGGTSLFALLGGTWFPLTHGFLHDLGLFMPSYWLVQAGHVGLTGHGWPLRGWITVAAWALLLAAGAAYAFRRDTKRV
ncbi:MAG TPA: ABC transporter permease [Solirubrobacteraceae bacterium]|jgi:ABC-2 type transport system permease protein|nr:ABC transporter permease [Solirubrobacteraceae bacterium]